MRAATETLKKAYVTGPQVAKRYQKSSMTIYRWARDDRLGFPKPMVINGRNLWDLAELESWEAKVRSGQ